MKPLAVAAWSMIMPFGEDDATINALFELSTQGRRASRLPLAIILRAFGASETAI